MGQDNSRNLRNANSIVVVDYSNKILKARPSFSLLHFVVNKIKAGLL